MASNKGVSRDRHPIRFVVNGYELETSEATIRYLPETYLTWLLDNCYEDVINGRPIVLKTSPKRFYSVVQRLSFLRKHKVPVSAMRSGAQVEKHLSNKRRKAMEPGPIRFASEHKTEHNCPEICRIKTPLPTDVTDLDSSIEFAIRAISEIIGFISTWPTFFDKLVVFLTCGKNGYGVPIIWPHLFHLFNSKSSEAGESVLVHNSETSGMDEVELESLFESVHVTSQLQHKVRSGLREIGHQSVFSDMRIDLNNFSHWRIARLSDYGIRQLDNDFTVRCLVVNV
eukprot:g5479.t1